MSFLKEPCLCLNRHWQPVTFIPVRTAIENVMRDMGSFMIGDGSYMLMGMEEWMAHDHEVTEADRWIRTANQKILVPEVIVLKKYGERPPQKISFNRGNLWKRDEFSCQYCGDQLPSNKLQIEHVMPRSRGGPTSWDNCVAACNACNSRKADKTPVEARMRLRKKPATPDWKPGIRVPSGAVRQSWEPFLAKERVA